MAGPKPMRIEFGIHYRLESCVVLRSTCILIWQWRGVPCKNLPESLSWSASCGSLSAPSSRTHRRKSGQPFWPVTTLPTLHFKAVQKLLSDLSTEIQRSAVRPVSRQFWPKQKQTSAGPARIEWGFHATFHQRLLFDFRYLPTESSRTFFRFLTSADNKVGGYSSVLFKWEFFIQMRATNLPHPLSIAPLFWWKERGIKGSSHLNENLSLE